MLSDAEVNAVVRAQVDQRFREAEENESLGRGMSISGCGARPRLCLRICQRGIETATPRTRCPTATSSRLGIPYHLGPLPVPQTRITLRVPPIGERGQLKMPVEGIDPSGARRARRLDDGLRRPAARAARCGHRSRRPHGPSRGRAPGHRIAVTQTAARPAPQGAARRAQALPATLTSCTSHPNREIAQALFITTKTAKAHLSRVHRMLEITRRARLAGALTGQLSDSREDPYSAATLIS